MYKPAWVCHIYTCTVLVYTLYVHIGTNTFFDIWFFSGNYPFWCSFRSSSRCMQYWEYSFLKRVERAAETRCQECVTSRQFQHVSKYDSLQQFMCIYFVCFTTVKAINLRSLNARRKSIWFLWNLASNVCRLSCLISTAQLILYISVHFVQWADSLILSDHGFCFCIPPVGFY